MRVSVKTLTSHARPAAIVLISPELWPESWLDLEQVANTLSQAGR